MDIEPWVCSATDPRETPFYNGYYINGLGFGGLCPAGPAGRHLLAVRWRGLYTYRAGALGNCAVGLARLAGTIQAKDNSR